MSKILSGPSPTKLPLPAPSASLPEALQTLELHSYDAKSSTWLPHVQDFSVALESRSIGVLTWNIEMATAEPARRLEEILNYIDTLLSSNSSLSHLPIIILIQELHYTCFPTLLSNSFVRETYATTNISSSSRDSTYGTLTLVPKSLAGYVTTTFRTPFHFKPPAPSTYMCRDGLYVDLEIPLTQRTLSDVNSQASPQTRIRIANTHLESLNGHGDLARPVQLKSISEYLSCDGLNGGIVGGDMNAISASDLNLAEEVGLADAWKLKLGQKSAQDALEESAGHTWGYQPPWQFPPSRMDKILFCGDSLEMTDIEVIGVGLKLQKGTKQNSSASWLSDHYGLLAKFTLVNVR